MDAVRADRTLERALLGGVLRFPESRHAVRVALPQDGFADPKLGATWRALLALWDEGTTPDSLTLAERVLVEARPLVVPAIEIESLEAYAPGRSEAVEGIAKRLAQIALARRCELAAKRIVGAANDPSVSPEELAQLSQSEVLLATTETQVRGPVPALRIAEEYLRELDERLNRGVVAGCSTGLEALDRFARLEPGKLWIAAGRPGMGKSAFAGHLTLSVARAGKTVLVFSLEMPRSEWMERLACSIAGIDSHALREARVTKEEMSKLVAALNEIGSLPILIDDSDSLNLWQLRSRAIATKSQHESLGLIIVDYLQLVRGDADRRESNREQEVAEISRSGKGLSKQLACTVMMLAQLNRKCEERGNKRPLMSDLRESGAIEQDADVLAFLYRDEVYNKQSDDAGVAEVIIAKQRGGAMGIARTSFDARLTRFANLEESHEPSRYPVPREREPIDEAQDEGEVYPF